GIRDWSVTGVQTCALPIYRVTFNTGAPTKSCTSSGPALPRTSTTTLDSASTGATVLNVTRFGCAGVLGPRTTAMFLEAPLNGARSEQRRVGGERTRRWCRR